MNYLSVLWRHIRAFSFETAGTFDRDCDGVIFTDIADMPRIELDLRKGGSDVYAVQKYFTDKLLGLDTGASYATVSE